MRFARFGVATLVMLVISNPVFATARYMPKGELIQTAEIIAVVEINETSNVSVKGQHWTYRQAADAVTLQTIKGELPMRFVIHAKKSFICAWATYEAKARYVVFLQREGELYSTVNHQLGQFKVAEDKINWFLDDNSLAAGEQRLDDVIRAIEVAVAGKKVALAAFIDANDDKEESIDDLIKKLSSDDGQVRIAATNAIFARRSEAVDPLRQAGAKQISPFDTIGTRRIDIVYSLMVGLAANPPNNRAG